MIISFLATGTELSGVIHDHLKALGLRTLKEMIPLVDDGHCGFVFSCETELHEPRVVLVKRTGDKTHEMTVFGPIPQAYKLEKYIKK